VSTWIPDIISGFVDHTGAMERKVLNDAVAYLRSLAQLRGRNADWAETAGREGATAALAAFYRPCPFPAAPAQPAPRRHQSDRPDCAAQMDALPAPDGSKFQSWAARLADVMPTRAIRGCQWRPSVSIGGAPITLRMAGRAMGRRYVHL
jgi:hypothetical protein